MPYVKKINDKLIAKATTKAETITANIDGLKNDLLNGDLIVKNSDTVDGLESSQFQRNDTADLDIRTYPSFGDGAKRVAKYLGLITDSKPGLVLFAKKYDGTNKLPKEGFIGKVILSRGGDTSYNITEEYDVVCTVSYDGSYSHFFISGNSSNAYLVEVTYNNEQWYGFYSPSNMSRTVWIDGFLYTTQDPIFIADASSYAVTKVNGSDFFVNQNTVWTSENDGSGSGLDADKLDGLDSTQFIRSDVDNTASGVITFSETVKASKQGNSLLVGNSTGRVTNSVADYAGIELYGSNSSAYLSTQDGNGRIQLKWNATSGVNETFLVAGEHAGFWEFDPATPTNELFHIRFADGSSANAGDSIPWQDILHVGTQTFSYLGNTVWHNGNTPVSKATSGYMKLPNGLIIQWGSVQNGPNPVSLTFPIAFPNARFVLLATPNRDDSSSGDSFFVIDDSTVDGVNEKTGASLHSFNHDDSDHSSTGDYIYWLAIGY